MTTTCSAASGSSTVTASGCNLDVFAEIANIHEDVVNFSDHLSVLTLQLSAIQNRVNTLENKKYDFNCTQYGC